MIYDQYLSLKESDFGCLIFIKVGNYYQTFDDVYRDFEDIGIIKY